MEIQWFKATTSRWGDQAQQRGGLPNNLLESSCFNINIPPRTSKEDARAIFEFSSYLARLSFPPFKTLQRIPMTFWSKTALPLLRVANPVSFPPCLNNAKILIEWRWTENRWKINDNSPLFPGKKTAQHCARPGLDAAERGGKFAKKEIWRMWNSAGEILT